MKTNDITPYMADMTEHGSAVADIIYRMNPDAAIYSVRVLDRDNEAPLSRIIEGVRWCMENDVDVINMSFGAYQESQVLQQVIDEAAEQGIVIVAAAGNSGNQGVAFPAAYKDVLSVGAVDAQVRKTEDSAVGDEVDLVAPGALIDVQSMLGLYTTVGGTSIVAAHASGAASVLMVHASGADSMFINGLLKESANYISEDAGYGNGLLDLDYALERYDTYEQMYEEAVQDGGEDVAEIVLEENGAELPVFTEEEVKAEALWRAVEGIEGYYTLYNTALGYANENLDFISAVAARALKAGAVAPDVYEMSSEFHGAIKWNYITTYRFITKAASLDGDTANINKKVTGQPQTSFDNITAQISLNGLVSGMHNSTNNLGNVSWSKAIGASDYTGSTARLAKLRRIFIYGMAMHEITDTFAHDAYVTENGVTYRLEHDGDGGTPADNPDKYRNRFVDAGEAAKRVMIAYNDTAIGGLSDFRPADTQSSRGYYLGELLTCAKKANYGFTPSQLQSWFGELDYSETGIPVN